MENSEKKNSKLKGRVVKFAGATVLAGALAIRGLAIYDSSIDHTQKICPFVSVLGVQHQVNMINKIDGLQAKYEKNIYIIDDGKTVYPNGDPVRITVSAIAEKLDDETASYMAPSGYVISGKTCYKTIYQEPTDAVVIRNEDERITNILTLK